MLLFGNSSVPIDFQTLALYLHALKSMDAYRFTLKSGLEEGNLSLLKVAGSTHIRVRQQELF